MSGGVTTNYGLKKPNFNQKPWDTDVNSNWDLIDAILYTITQIPNIAGVWRNSTQYNVGQNVLDPQSLTFYQCVVANVSAVSGSFAADRAANPGNWTVTTASGGYVRYDQGQVLTSGQQAQARTNIGAIAQSALDVLAYVRYDAAQTLTYNQILQVLNNLLIDGTESILTAAATTDIGNAGSQNVRIDGTTTIVSFGARPNKFKILRFTGSLVLTNSASIVLPGGANITTQAGDTCIATSDAGNNWYVRAYQRKDGSSVVPPVIPPAFTTANLYTVPATPSTGVTLAAADFDVPYNVTGTTTITVGNVGNGFRTGPIKNNNATTGVVTIAVPAGATLDGQTNGTLLLFPGQKYRVIQTGATSYVSEVLILEPVTQFASSGNVASLDLAIADGFKQVEIRLRTCEPTSAGLYISTRVSYDGTTFISGSNYTYNFIQANSSGITSNQPAITVAAPIMNGAAINNGGASSLIKLYPDLASNSTIVYDIDTGYCDTGGYAQSKSHVVVSSATGRVKAFRLLWNSSTGTLQGSIKGIVS